MSSVTKLTPPAARGALLAVAAANMVWGVSFLFGKVALRELTASHVALGRFVLASLLLFPLVLRLRSSFRWADLPLFLLSGVLMVPVMMLLQLEGLALTSATSAALIIGTIPVLLAIAAAVVDRERMRLKGWTAVACSTLGACLLVGAPAAGRSLTGDLLVFASTVAAVAWILATRRLLRRYEALPATALIIVLGTLTLLPISLWMDGMPSLDVNLSTWSALGILGVGCTALTYNLWNWGLQGIPAARAGVFVNLEPLVGAVLGVMVLKEAVQDTMLLGGSLILLAALLTTFEPRVKQPVEMA